MGGWVGFRDKLTNNHKNYMYIPYSYIFTGPNRRTPLWPIVMVVTVVMFLGLPWDAANACPLFDAYFPGGGWVPPILPILSRCQPIPGPS